MKLLRLLCLSAAIGLVTYPAIATTKVYEPVASTTKEINSGININTANIDILTQLPGVGTSKAKAIIEYRQANGNFASIAEIKLVKGIGDKLFEKLKSRISVQ